jgi:hypothetical protein
MPRTRHGNYNENIKAEMAGPCKQNGRSQRAKESATEYSWGGRSRGTPRKRRLDDMEDDLRKIGVTCWRIKDRKEKNM